MDAAEEKHGLLSLSLSNTNTHTHTHTRAANSEI